MSGRERNKQKRYLKLLAMYGDYARVSRWCSVSADRLAKWRKRRPFRESEVAAMERSCDYGDLTSAEDILFQAKVVPAINRDPSLAWAKYYSDEKIPKKIRIKGRKGMAKLVMPTPPTRDVAVAWAKYCSDPKNILKKKRTTAQAPLSGERYHDFLFKCLRGRMRPGLWTKQDEVVARIIAGNLKPGRFKMAKSRMLKALREAAVPDTPCRVRVIQVQKRNKSR